MNATRKVGLTAVVALVMAVCVSAGAPQEPPYQPQLNQPGKDVQWVPTPPELVEKMLDLARLTPDDRLVDLGSGDGVLVIAAARRGARARGIEYDKRLVEFSKRAARDAGVDRLTRFVQGDIFKTSFSDESVVTTFLLPSMNRQLLPTFLANKLIEIDSRFAQRITLAERLKNFDAVIATGSDNSSRYFQYYFGKYPHIIRKNRTSCAIVSGSETEEDLRLLGKDVFTYFGLGCRNVSKLFLPESFDPVSLIKAWDVYVDIINHHKYHNNYDYQKSILLVNKIPFYDSGFVILHENEKLVSPISVVYLERYKTARALAAKLTSVYEKIQCIVGKTQPDHIPFGMAQSPELWDYADRVDTFRFLEELT